MWQNKEKVQKAGWMLWETTCNSLSSRAARHVGNNTEIITEIIAESVHVSSALDLPHIPYGACLFPLDNMKWIFLVSVETCKRKKMIWKVCKGASLRSTLVLPF